MEIPALFKVLCLFAGIVILYRLRIPLWLDLPVISFLAGLWFGACPLRSAGVMMDAALEPETLYLGAVVVLIMAFSNMMDGAGILKKIVAAFGDLLGKSMYSGAALPALIGLLPMPGGAIFSAPMVQEACGDNGGQSPEQKSAVNYWFRHIWEYWWPLYPGVILASYLFDAPMWKLVLLHAPLTLVAVAGGWFFILRPAFRSDTGRPANGRPKAALAQTISRSMCIIIVIVIMLGLSAAVGMTSWKGTLGGKFWPVIAAFIIGGAWLMISSRISVRILAKYIFNRNQLTMLLLVAGVMIFRDMLVAMDAFSGARSDLERYNVPPIVVIAALPFLSGFVMGLAIAFVGASFPLVISLLPDNVMHSDMRFAYMALAYSFGYMGMMLSPVHFCLIMTKDYFKADLAGVYRWILPPAILIMFAGIAFFALYSAIFG